VRLASAILLCIYTTITDGRKAILLRPFCPHDRAVKLTCEAERLQKGAVNGLDQFTMDRRMVRTILRWAVKWSRACRGRLPGDPGVPGTQHPARSSRARAMASCYRIKVARHAKLSTMQGLSTYGQAPAGHRGNCRSGACPSPNGWRAPQPLPPPGTITSPASPESQRPPEGGLTHPWQLGIANQGDLGLPRISQAYFSPRRLLSYPL